ncbi:MAG: RNA polymerase sigma-70 factor [Tannerella sp.]|jgi:RNA polymerase sigma-70 factor (ECF subfamily)|nr:RNA polymerase sigma-70 factor [Tannerella sp.]
MQDIQAYHVVEQIFKSQFEQLKACAFRYVNDWETAKDIVQNAFCELWIKKDEMRFDEPEAVKAYLFKTVCNRSINAVNERRREIYSLDETHETQIVEAYMETYYMQNQERTLLMKELKSEVVRFVRTLPPQCRKIYMLSRSHELKNREIAERLGISVKAVEKQISKAIQGLKDHLRSKGLIN